MKNILVTGAGGSIGSEICMQLNESPGKFTLVINDISELALFEIEQKLKSINENSSNARMIVPFLGDLSNDNFANILSLNYSFSCVYHAAAYKHVNLSQVNKLQYFANNLGATKNAFYLASESDGLLVHISTDKAVYPTNAMGQSKRLCEFYLLSEYQKNKDNQIKIVRFGNVLNSNGSVIPIFKKQIEKGGPVTVTDREATRYFMSISDAVRLVLSAKDTRLECLINILDMGQPQLIDRLARSLIEQAGCRPVEKKILKDDIVISYIGLREGEKLHEELSYSELFGSNIQDVYSANENMCPDGGLVDELIGEILNGKEPSISRINWESGQRIVEK